MAESGKAGEKVGSTGAPGSVPASSTAMKSPSKFLSCFTRDDAVAVFWLPPRPAGFTESLSCLQDMLKSVTISQVSHSIRAGALRRLRTHLLIWDRRAHSSCRCGNCAFTLPCMCLQPTEGIMEL